MGKRKIVQDFFAKKAKLTQTPWIGSMSTTLISQTNPMPSTFPARYGHRIQQDIEILIDEMQTALSAAFESEEYQNRRQTIFESFKEKQAQLFNELQEKAFKKGWR
jgi:hypothetical protein